MLPSKTVSLFQSPESLFLGAQDSYELTGTGLGQEIPLERGKEKNHPADGRGGRSNFRSAVSHDPGN